MLSLDYYGTEAYDISMTFEAVPFCRQKEEGQALRLWIDLNATKGGLDSDDKTTENAGMEIRGRVHNGVVVREGEFPLPEGTEVIVSSGAAPATKPVGKQRIEFPLVRSKRPGSLQLTGR